MVVQSELEKVDIAEQRLKYIRRNYTDLLSEPNYQRAEKFMKLVEVYFNPPEKIRTPEFIAHVEEIRRSWQHQAEDIQAILFFCWYRSKMLGTDAYEEVLLRLGVGLDG